MNVSDLPFLVQGFITIFYYDHKHCKILEVFQVFFLLIKNSYWFKIVEESNQIALCLKSDIRILRIEISFDRNDSRQSNTPKYKWLFYLFYP